MLSNAGCEVKIKKSSTLMHMNLVIVDGKRFATGSYNWSASAKEQDNDYRVCWRDCSNIGPYIKKFNSMWTRKDNVHFGKGEKSSPDLTAKEF